MIKYHNRVTYAILYHISCNIEKKKAAMSVKTLEFLLYLRIQQFTKLSLKSSLASGEEYLFKLIDLMQLLSSDYQPIKCLTLSKISRMFINQYTIDLTILAYNYIYTTLLYCNFLNNVLLNRWPNRSKSPDLENRNYPNTKVLILNYYCVIKYH